MELAELGNLRCTMQPEAFNDPEMPSWHEERHIEDEFDGLGPVEESFLLDSFMEVGVESQDSEDADAISPQKSMFFQCSKRRLQKVMQDNQLRDFLQRHGLGGLTNSRRFGCDDLNPIHLAAREGDHQVLRSLLRIGTNLQQKTPLGQTALEIAKRANRNGSHDLVIEILRKTKVFQSPQMFILGI